MIDDNASHLPARTKSQMDTARDALQIKLYDYLAKHSAKYTLNDSSSLPVELAEELFRSLCYVLGMDEAMPDDAIMALAEADLDARFAAGIKQIQHKIILAKKLWRTAVQSLPRVENTSLYDTLTSIKRMSKRYDYRFFAHQVPCDIDYQLANPVPESLLGIDYVIAWLTHLITENAFLGHFAREDCIAVLEKACPDYIGLHINLYEPIAAQALGVALAGGDVRTLSLSPAQMDELTAMLTPVPRTQRERLLVEAAKTLAVTFQLESQTSQDYLNTFAKSLVPRISAALLGGGLEGVFWVLNNSV